MRPESSISTSESAARMLYKTCRRLASFSRRIAASAWRSKQFNATCGRTARLSK